LYRKPSRRRTIAKWGTIAALSAALGVGAYAKREVIARWHYKYTEKGKIETQQSLRKNPRQSLKEMFGISGAQTDSILAEAKRLCLYWDPKKPLPFDRLVVTAQKNYGDRISDYETSLQTARRTGNTERAIRFDNIIKIIEWGQRNPEIIKQLRDSKYETKMLLLKSLIDAEDNARMKAKAQTEKALRKQQEGRTKGILKARKGMRV